VCALRFALCVSAERPVRDTPSVFAGDTKEGEQCPQTKKTAVSATEKEIFSWFNTLDWLAQITI